MSHFAANNELKNNWEQALDRDFPTSALAMDQGTVQLRECGSRQKGPAFVLLHGIGSGAASWLPTVQHLKSDVYTLAWEAPGYGQSSPLQQRQPKAEDYALRLEKVLQAMNIPHAVLVGHSLGAMTALALARNCPQKVSHVVLISPARGYGAVDRHDQAVAVRARRLANLAQFGIAGMAERRAPAMLSPQPTADALHWVRWNMARLNVEGYLQAVELLCGDDLLRQSAPTVPVNVFCGDSDGITPPDGCRNIAEALCAPFELIAQAGHASPIERPEAVAACLDQIVSLYRGIDS